MPDLDFLVEVNSEFKILIPNEYFELIDAINTCYEIKVGSKGIRLVPTGLKQPISIHGENDKLSFLTINEQGAKVIESAYVRMKNWRPGKKFELKIGKKQIRIESLGTRTQVFIGEDVYDQLPSNEQDQFEVVERYKPDAINEQMNECEERGVDWTCPFGPFICLEDYEDFWGDDWSMVGGYVYKKVCEELDETEKRNLVAMTKKSTGNQLRIKEE